MLCYFNEPGYSVLQEQSVKILNNVPAADFIKDSLIFAIPLYFITELIIKLIYSSK